MKIKIKRSELVKAISVVENALDSKVVIDSYRGIKLEAKNNLLLITASKSDLSITYTVDKDFEILTEGTIIIPGTQFSTLVKKTEEEIFEITHVGNVTYLKTNKSKINLFEYDVTSYPTTMYELSENPIKLQTSILSNAYYHTRHASSINATRPILSGINFNFQENLLTVSASDSKRLAISKFNLECDTLKNFTIQTKNLAHLPKILDTAEVVDVELHVAQNQVVIVGNNLKIKTRLLEGEFPDLQKVIPTKSAFSYEVNAKELRNILGKVTSLTDGDTSNLTTEIVDDNLLLSSFFREIGGIEEFCGIKNLSGTPFKISFDPKMLIDAISAIGENELYIKFGDSELSAFSITGLKNKENIQVISPMRVG